MLKSHSITRTPTVLLSYAVVLSTVGATVVAGVWLGPTVKHTFTLFFCAIVLSSWFGGIWAGVLATILSAIALDYFFVPPIYALGIGLQEAPDMIAFVASALLVSWLCAENKLAKASRRHARYVFDGEVRASGPGFRNPVNSVVRPTRR
jgi:K+-sensing histidine kinase KdpD